MDLGSCVLTRSLVLAAIAAEFDEDADLLEPSWLSGAEAVQPPRLPLPPLSSRPESRGSMVSDAPDSLL